MIQQLITNETPVNVFLTNGVKLIGRITKEAEIDDTCGYIILERNGDTQLVYKHSIATICPNFD